MSDPEIIDWHHLQIIAHGHTIVCAQCLKTYQHDFQFTSAKDFILFCDKYSNKTIYGKCINCKPTLKYYYTPGDKEYSEKDYSASKKSSLHKNMFFTDRETAIKVWAIFMARDEGTEEEIEEEYKKNKIDEDAIIDKKLWGNDKPTVRTGLPRKTTRICCSCCRPLPEDPDMCQECYEISKTESLY